MGWRFIVENAFVCAVTAAFIGTLLYFAVVEVGRYLGLDEDHYPVLAPDAYVVSDLEMWALFAAGVPVGWYAHRLLSMVRERAELDSKWTSYRRASSNDRD